LRQASLKLTFASMRWKVSSENPSLSVPTESKSASAIGTTMRTTRKAMDGSRRVNGRSCPVRVRIRGPA